MKKDFQHHYLLFKLSSIILGLTIVLASCTTDTTPSSPPVKSYFELFSSRNLTYTDSLLDAQTFFDTLHLSPIKTDSNTIYFSEVSDKLHYSLKDNHQIFDCKSDIGRSIYVINQHKQLIYTYFSNLNEPDDHTYYKNGVAVAFRIGEDDIAHLNQWDAKTFTEADYHNFDKLKIYTYDSLVSQSDIQSSSVLLQGESVR